MDFDKLKSFFLRKKKKEKYKYEDVDAPELDDPTEIVDAPEGVERSNSKKGQTQTSFPKQMGYGAQKRDRESKKRSAFLILLLLLLAGVGYFGFLSDPLQDSGDVGEATPDSVDRAEQLEQEFERTKKQIKKAAEKAGKAAKEDAAANGGASKDVSNKTTKVSKEQKSSKKEKVKQKKQLSEEELLAKELQESEQIDRQQKQKLQQRYKIDETAGQTLEVGNLNDTDEKGPEELEISKASELEKANLADETEIDVDLALNDLAGEQDAKDTTVLSDTSKELTEKMRKDAGIEEEKRPEGKVPKEYVAPPNYLNRGRGLVYNCKEGHWACVEKKSYLTCKDNYLFNADRKKAIECFPSSVLASTKDCARMQIEKVNRLAKTKFCKL